MFSQERDLVDAFTSRSGELLSIVLPRSTSQTFLILEFNSHFGVADIVLGTYKSSLSRRKKRHPINPNWISPLATFRRNEQFTLEWFCNMYGLSRTTAIKCTREYQQAGFLKEIATNTYKVVQEYGLSTEVVISIEAKLKDWRKALLQAQRYKRFSDLTFVLLDGYYSAPAIKNLELFHERNIGLLSINRSGLIVHLLPKKNTRKATDSSLRLAEIAYHHYAADPTAY